MQPLTSVPRQPTPVSNRLTVSIAAGPLATRRAVEQLDLLGPALRATRALGLGDRVAPTAAGIRWRPERDGGHIDVEVDVRVGSDGEGGSSLTIVTRCAASDEPTHERLLDAWPLLGPVVATLARRAARAVKHHAEHDRFEAAAPSDEALAA